MSADATRPKSILVAHGMASSLDVLPDVLEGEGYDVRWVQGGPAALEAALSEPPDLILLEAGMLPMSGYEVCERLKRDEVTKDIPVIFVCAGDAPGKVRALSLGAVDYVSKPFEALDVLTRVRTQLRLRRTELALAESHANLRQLELLRHDLVNMVVHDLRSPLTALLYSFSFIRDGLGAKPPPAVLEDVDAGEVAARVMIGMANDLLDVSRLESGRLPLQRADQDLVRVVQEAVGNVRGIHPEREVFVEGSPSVVGSFDAGLIRRVVENLVSNGLKHTPAEQALRVQVREDVAESLGQGVGARPLLRVVVLDQGEGVPEEFRERIFEKFGAVCARDAKKYHSVGLGLAFCKLVVDAHGGQIGVDARVGGGSAFWFAIPSRVRAE